MPVAEPFTRLEYTFTIAPMGDATSTLKWNLEDVAGGTRLSLRHDGLPQGADMFGLTLALDTGGGDHLARMRDAAHTPQSMPMPTSAARLLRSASSFQVTTLTFHI